MGTALACEESDERELSRLWEPGRPEWGLVSRRTPDKLRRWRTYGVRGAHHSALTCEPYSHSIMSPSAANYCTYQDLHVLQQSGAVSDSSENDNSRLSHLRRQ